MGQARMYRTVPLVLDGIGAPQRIRNPWVPSRAAGVLHGRVLAFLPPCQASWPLASSPAPASEPGVEKRPAELEVTLSANPNNTADSGAFPHVPLIILANFCGF